MRLPTERHRRLQLALDRLERCDAVGDVSEELGLSRRRLIEVFTADVGMTPKLFSRVRRFHRAFAAMKSRTRSWSELALDCGYCDQSHLIRDFNAFAGASPADIARHREESVKDHHVALTDR
jgi:AraC-like DNA-binding protein